MVEEPRIRLGIFRKLLVTMLITSAIPLVAIWYMNYQSISTRTTQYVNQQLGQVTDSLVRDVVGWVEMNQRMLKQNATLPAMRTMNAKQQNTILELVTQEYGWIHLAFTVGLDGKNIGRSDGKAPRYYGDRVYVKQVLNGEQLGKQVFIEKTSDLPAFVLSTPIHNKVGHLQGVLAIVMTIGEMSASVTNARIGDTGYAFLLDESGKVIAHQSKEYTKIRKDFSDHPAYIVASLKGEGSVVYEDADGKKVIAFTKKTKHGWIMVAEQDYVEAFGTIGQANRNALILLAITWIFVAFAAYILSQGLRTPIRNLTLAADDISRGRLDGNISGIERNDEIGALARAVERVGVSVRLAMERLSHK